MFQHTAHGIESEEYLRRAAGELRVASEVREVERRTGVERTAVRAVFCGRGGEGYRRGGRAAVVALAEN